MIKSFLNLEGHQNQWFKITDLFLKGWIWPLGEASAGEGLHLQPAQQACFSRPGRSQGLLYKHLRHWFIDSLIQSWFVKISLRRCHALTVADGAFSHKINYITIFKEILNPKRHPNRTTGSKGTAILLNEWNFPIGGASSGRVCACSLRSRLVLLCPTLYLDCRALRRQLWVVLLNHCRPCAKACIKLHIKHIFKCSQPHVCACLCSLSCICTFICLYLCFQPCISAFYVCFLRKPSCAPFLVF